MGLYKGRNLIPVSLGNTLGSKTSAGFSAALDLTTSQLKEHTPVIQNPAITLVIVIPDSHAFENTCENWKRVMAFPMFLLK